MQQTDQLKAQFLIDEKQALEAIKRLQEGMAGLDQKATQAYKSLKNVPDITSNRAAKAIQDKTKELAEVDKAVNALIQRLQERAKTPAPMSEPDGMSGGALLAGVVGGFVGSAAIGLISTAGLAIRNFIDTSRDAFLEFQKGTRILKAQAVETGLSFEALTEKAEKFGKITALGSGQAREVFAQLANFARAAGQTDKLDKFTQAFSDLAAARGLQPEILGDVARQLNALVDEATDKLLNANPSAFFESYAKSIGKTASTLTDAEKRAAVFFAVIERGNLFLGQSQLKFDEVGGATLRFNKAVEDAKTGLGELLVQAGDFAVEFTTAFGRGVKSFAPEAETGAKVVESLLFGQSEKLLAAIQEYRGKRLQARQELDALLSEPFTEAAKNDELRRKAEEEFQRSLEELKKQLEKYQKAKLGILTGTLDGAEARAIRSLSDKLLSLEGIKDAASVLQRKRDIQNAIEDVKRTASRQVDELLAEIHKKTEFGTRGDLAQLRFKVDELERAGISTDDYNKLAQELRKSVLGSFEKDIGKAGQNVEKLKKVLEDLETYRELRPEDRTELIEKVTKTIADSVRQATARVDEMRKSARSLFDEMRDRLTDNPFVRLAQTANTAFERIREVTKGLGEDVRRVFEKMQQQIIELNKQQIRIQLRTQIADLEAEVQALNEPIAEVVERRLKATLQPDVLRRLGFDIINPSLELGDQSQRQALDDFIAQERERLTKEEETRRRQELIQKKIDAGGFARTEEERRLADKAIIDATRGIDPALLTQEQRRQASAAREREIERLRTSEESALKYTAEQTQLQRTIADILKNLYDVAKTKGVDAIVRIIDDTSGRVSTRTAITRNATGLFDQ